MNESIRKQKEEIYSGLKRFTLREACTIGTGILSFDEFVSKTQAADIEEDSVTFFVPASGSGSRMFAFLFDFIETRVENDLTSIFFKHLHEFPFYESLELENHGLTLDDKLKVAERILFDEEFNYANKPKGLIPFFKNGKELRNPFQLHLLQAEALLGDKAKLHFTIQEEFESVIAEEIAKVNHHRIAVDFSSQRKESDAYCFDQSNEVIVRNGNFLRRPAGHGALLDNLNELPEDYVFIKNIDNLQFGEAAEESLNIWRRLFDFIQGFEKELKQVVDSEDLVKLRSLQKAYQLMYHSNDAIDWVEWREKPIRICGMVRNQGKPGGGPFWVEVDGTISNQIVEMSQIDMKDLEQSSIVQSATHFNPVFMLCGKTNRKGERIDLMKYRNDNLVLPVVKMDNGEEVRYRELPGLWNGSMHHWISIFVEIPGEVFTPVKTVVDLI